MAEGIVIGANVDLSSLHLERYGSSIVTAVRKQIKQAIWDVVRLARRQDFHRYSHHTRMLEKSTVVNDDTPPMVGAAHLDTGIAHYGPYVHEGHGSWRPDRFLYDALEERRETILHDIQQSIDKAIRGV